MNNSLPLVSVIVPVYNVEKYLCRAVDSLLNQTYRNMEILLIDDGSSDNCPSICDTYSQQDLRVKAIHQKNAGVSAARNSGLDLASGEFITFLDSDDWIDVNMIQTMVHSLIEKDCDAVCVSINIVNEKCKVIKKFQIHEDVILSGTETTKLMLRDKFPYNFCWGKMFRRSAFNGIRFPEGRLYEDNATTYKAIHRSSKVCLLSECLYYYFREREGNTTSELKSDRAAFSYYCGCLNCTEYIQFCNGNPIFLDVIPDIEYFMAAWSKLCIESAIKTNRNEYKDYCHKVKKLIQSYNFTIPLRLKWILKCSKLYYYLYPLFGQNS